MALKYYSKDQLSNMSEVNVTMQPAEAPTAKIVVSIDMDAGLEKSEVVNALEIIKTHIAAKGLN
jgi:hypothetical protein